MVNKHNREYINVLMRHVFRRPENIASVTELIEAKKEQDSFLKNVMKRFMSGKKDSRNGTQPMSPSAASPERHSASGLDHGMLGSFNMTGGSNHQGPMSSFSRHNQNFYEIPCNATPIFFNLPALIDTCVNQSLQNSLTLVHLCKTAKS